MEVAIIIGLVVAAVFAYTRGTNHGRRTVSRIFGQTPPDRRDEN